MKKIFTIILFAAGTITIATAQSKNQHDNTYINHEVSYIHDSHDSYGSNDNFRFSYKEKEAKLKQIERAFDERIAFAKNSRFLSNREKSKEIKLLEKQKRIEMNKVQMQYEQSDHKAYGHDAKKW